MPNSLFVSYAQHGEDVLLWRAFKGVHEGFYIDVGAYHPIADSVTQAFYERGWRGINIEPVVSSAEEFYQARPRDINLAVAAYNNIGSRNFYELPGSGLSTFDIKLLRETVDPGGVVKEHLVPTRTLADICRQYVTGDIHFLKVDAEQSEREVLEGADFKCFRPWIILVEATMPNSDEPSHQAWESILLDAGYVFLFFDGLNRFYASAEKAEELRRHFDRPANPIDGYQTHKDLASQVAAHTLEKLREERTTLKEKISLLVQSQTASVAKIKALENKLRYHSTNPKRALRLWWDRHSGNGFQAKDPPRTVK